MNSLFCRHNRFTAECPICSKDTVLSRPAAPERAKPAKPSARPRGAGGRRAPAQVAATRYPHVSVAGVEHEGRIYEIRLEQVPGALRMGQWRGGELERKAPILTPSALRELIEEATGRGFLAVDLPETSAEATGEVAVSAGRSGDMNEELRLERMPEPGFVRIARWVFWPGEGVGWELHDSPVMLPPKRYEQVLQDAAAKGLV